PGLPRRDFLGLSLGGALGLALGSPARLFAQERPRAAKLPGFGGAKRCVVLWLNGGPSQLETFDPKPGHRNGGPTKAIRTSVPGVELAHTLPRLAERTNRIALVRSMSTREGNHQRARYYLHTGYVPSGTVKHPDLGALVCQQLADPDFDLPSYVNIGGPAPGPGILGVTYAPFTIGDPRKPVQNLAPPRDVDDARFRRRRALMGELGKGFAEERPGSETAAYDAVLAKADALMHSPRAKAFDLADEPEATRALYGESAFGQGCLMARRLLEQGVKVVEVQLNGWDTHRDNFTRTQALCADLDAGFSALLDDLAAREMLGDTLILCLGEFGRTPRINGNEGRDHFARAWSLALAGGPIRGGRVVGATAPDGTRVVDRPVGVPDLMATVCHALGLDAELTNYSKEGRPLTVVDAGGRPLRELFS
ncbi:MAG: DUF1501 domain-containing protein, partial [Planctomycetota bacterium]